MIRELEKDRAAAAVLDDAHTGDIQGAWGSIKEHDTAPRKNLWHRLATLAAIMGPGLVVMVADNDAGGIATYVQAGQNYGTSLLWTLFLLIPVLIVNQEMVVRLGIVTGVGHARLILERFGKFWAAFSVGDLFILNFLTLVTEFVGVSLALGYFGVSQYISVPIAAAVLIASVVTGSFRRWERAMYLCIAVSLVVWVMPFLVHVDAGQAVRDGFIPGVQNGLDSTALLIIIGIVGTTVAPWQLFFQQSNVVDKRLTPRWLKYQRFDTFFGAGLTNVAAAAFMVAAAFALRGTDAAGNFQDAGQTASAFARYVSPWLGHALAIVLLDASILGGAAVTLSTSYAFGDMFGMRHSLHRSVGNAKAFYAVYAGLVVVAAGIVLIPNAPLGLLTLAVQALAGILLPSATVFLVLLCNDRAVLGPHVNKPWLNAVASVIVGVLVVLSLILAATVFFPDIDARLLATSLFGALAVALLAIGVVAVVRKARKPENMEEVGLDAASWRMPPLATLPKPAPSLARRIGLLTLRGYLVLAVAMFVVKVVQLALGGAGGA